MGKMQELGLWTDEVREEVLATGGIQQLKHIPKEVRRVFETSLEIPWEYHLQHQRAFQTYTDNAVSKPLIFRKILQKKLFQIFTQPLGSMASRE